MIQDIVPEEDKDATVEILDEAVEGDTAWDKYNTMTRSQVFSSWSRRMTNGRLLVKNRGRRDLFKLELLIKF